VRILNLDIPHPFPLFVVAYGRVRIRIIVVGEDFNVSKAKSVSYLLSTRGLYVKAASCVLVDSGKERFFLEIKYTPLNRSKESR